MSEVLLRMLSRAELHAAGGADLAAAVADVRAVLRQLRSGDASMVPEASLPLGGGTEDARIYALPGSVGAPYDAVGLKWTAHRARSDADEPRTLSLTIVNERATGQPIGMVESADLTALRTAAVSAVALETIAPRPPRRFALLGAGMQARAHLRMLAERFPRLDGVAVWNRTAERLDALCRAAPEGWPVRRAVTIDDAVASSDVVIACTGALAPILGRDAVRPGRLIMQIGYDEVEFAAIDASDHVVVDAWGEFRLTSAKSLFRMHRAGRFPAERVAADLTAVLCDGWRPRPDASVYFSSFGLNVFDVALAARVLRAAAARGIGMCVPMFG